MCAGGARVCVSSACNMQRLIIRVIGQTGIQLSQSLDNLCLELIEPYASLTEGL